MERFEVNIVAEIAAGVSA